MVHHHTLHAPSQHYFTVSFKLQTLPIQRRQSALASYFSSTAVVNRVISGLTLLPNTLTLNSLIFHIRVFQPLRNTERAAGPRPGNLFFLNGSNFLLPFLSCIHLQWPCECGRDEEVTGSRALVTVRKRQSLC